jgi:hypothetical protein
MEECIGIRDHHSKEVYDNPRPKVPELITERISRDHVNLRPESIVHSTLSQALRHDIPVVTRIGYLKAESTTRFVDTYHHLCLVDQQNGPPFFN